MNYDALEREVHGYDARMTSRSEARRVRRAVTPDDQLLGGGPARSVRLQMAAALRSLADHLDTSSARLA